MIASLYFFSALGRSILSKASLYCIWIIVLILNPAPSQMCIRLLSSGGSLRQVLRLFARRSDLARVSSFVGMYSASVVALECLLHKANVKDITPALSG